MVKVKAGEIELYLDGYLKANLDTLRQKVEKKWDGVSLWVGEEGDGKTTATLQAALYLDPTLNIDRIVFNGLQFEEAINLAQPFQAIVWDEADDLGGHWASKMVQTIKRLMKRIRSKQLYIFLVTPTMFDLGKYFVIHRCKFLVHIYSKGLERGFLRFFSGESKTILYMAGYKMWNMYATKPNFVGAFTDLPKVWPIDMKAYQVKKDKAATSESLELNKLKAVFANIDSDGYYSRERLSERFDVSVSTITVWRREIRAKMATSKDFKLAEGYNSTLDLPKSKTPTTERGGIIEN